MAAEVGTGVVDGMAEAVGTEVGDGVVESISDRLITIPPTTIRPLSIPIPMWFMPTSNRKSCTRNPRRNSSNSRLS